MAIQVPVDLRVASVVSAARAEGAKFPSRVFRLDLGPLGEKTSVGQFALVAENELVGRRVAVALLGNRKMGKYLSECLVLGLPHPESPRDQKQAMPIYLDDRAKAGDEIF
jgi:tRNA-binding protein